MNISHEPIYKKNISDKTLYTAGKMYLYYFNTPPKRSSDWYTFYTRLYPLHSPREILLALSSMDVRDLDYKCSLFCHHDVRRKKALFEAARDVLNLTFQDIGNDRFTTNKSNGKTYDIEQSCFINLCYVHFRFSEEHICL